MRAPWQRLLGMALVLIVTVGVAVPAAAQQPGVTVSATMLGPLTEDVPSTASATYTVVLNAAPTGAVMLTVTSNNAAVAVDTDLTPRRRELTFTTMNWATAQPVTATATADLNAVDERVTLTHTLTGASEYMSVTVASVTVQVTDDEDPDLTLSVSNLAVNEGTSTAYTVRLATQPAGDVAVEVRSDNADVALQATGQATSVETLWLIFRRGLGSNAWNSAQAVTVHALTDTNANNESVTLTHTATGGDYGTVTKTLTMAVTDTTTMPVDPPGDVTPAFAAATLPAQTYKTRQQVRLQLPAATTGDPPLTYTLTPALPARLTYDGAKRRIMGAAQATMAATVYTHTVTDADGDNDSQTVSITIEENPQLEFRQPAPQYTPGVTYTLPAPDGGEDREQLVFVVTPSLPAGFVYTPPTLQSREIEGMVRSRYEDGGTIMVPPGAVLPTNTFTLKVTAADGGMAEISFWLRNEQPRFGDTVPPQEYQEGEQIEPLTLPRAIAGNEPLTYVLTPALPEGLMRTLPTDVSDGTITGTPTELQDSTTYTLTVTDADGQMAMLSFTIAVVDPMPRFNAPVDPQEYRLGKPIIPLTLPRATGGNEPLTYALTPTTLPEGLTFTRPTETSDGTITGTPTELHALTTYTLMATDTDGDTTDPPVSFTLAVVVDPMPKFNVTVDSQVYPRGVQIKPLSLPRATGGDRPLSYALTPALPEGLTFTRPTETSDGTITGTPTELHALTTYTLTATDTDEDTTDPPVSFTLTVELEDLMPSFEGATVDSQVYPRGVQIEPLPLPRATGGNGTLSYTLTPALPEGLTFTRPTDVSDGTITGTPTELQALTTYTLTVRDEDGDPDSITFTIEVKPGIQSRDLALVLAGVGRTLATDAVEILGGRFRSSPASRLQVTLGGQALRLTSSPPTAPPSPSSPTPSPLAGEGRGEGSFLQGKAPLLQGEPQKAGGSSSGSLQRATGLALGVARALGITLDLPSSSSPSPLAGEGRGEGPKLLQNNAPLLGRFPTDRSRSTTLSNLFRLQPVSGKDLLARSAFELPLTRTGDDGIPVWTLWGRGSAAGFSGQPEDDFKMDGTLYSGYIGVDYRPQSTVLLGLAVSHSTGDVSYERIGATKAAVDVELTSMLPYAHWQPRPGLGLWSLLGVGWGKIDLKAARAPRMHTTGLNSWLVAVGGRQALTTWQGIDLAAKTDAFLTTVQSKGKTNLPVARGHAQRMRLLMEGRTAVEVSSVSRLSPYMQLGGRYDSGTAEQGLGAELGGGVAYTRTDLGLSVEAQGRYLLAHKDGAFEDWGASVNVRMDPGVAGQGAYLTVAPVWGQTASGVDQLWGNAAGIPQVAGNATMPAAGWRPHRLAVDVGYGLALADERGFLTPYGGLALAGPGSSRYRLGSRLALSSSLAVTLEGERAEQPGQEPAHGVSVRVGWQW